MTGEELLHKAELNQRKELLSMREKLKDAVKELIVDSIAEELTEEMTEEMTDYFVREIHEASSVTDIKIVKALKDYLACYNKDIREFCF